MLETWVWSLGRKIPWRREWLPTPVFLPKEFHGQRRLAAYSPWSPKSQTQLNDFRYGSPRHPAVSSYDGRCWTFEKSSWKNEANMTTFSLILYNSSYLLL